ncbi:hypothetical protein F383_10538 [Gossypium arboreum]|uniref:Uncharacterized protein n=1 Tax=Gossypium arboreum TaxID=29729 RepID=A0A0B0P9A0_GOSAR|nr:hypothetical protein F383_10538 [Gossypium arboreum]
MTRHLTRPWPSGVSTKVFTIHMAWPLSPHGRVQFNGSNTAW